MPTPKPSIKITTSIYTLFEINTLIYNQGSLVFDDDTDAYTTYDID
jgi:hypothetical protein